MTENWKDIKGFEGRYQVSDLGRVKSLPFMQRYLLRNGREAYRRTAEMILRPQVGRHGYVLVSLHLDNQRVARSVHSLVAEAFIEGQGETVNHKNGNKADNRADNLEWLSYTDNHIHAVYLGLNKQAVRVVHPKTGQEFPSMAEAARLTGLGSKYIARNFRRVR